MGYLRRSAKRILPSSFPNALNDVQTIDAYNHELVNILWTYFYPRKTIFFLPERPPLDSIAYKMCRLAGYNFYTKDQPQYDVVFKLEDATFKDPIPSTQFDVPHVINGQCTDISKRTLNAVFGDVFGYPLGVDPTIYDGDIVVKSNRNSTHDGSVVEGPLPPDEIQDEKVYQKAIDNRVEDGDLVLDYRVPLHGEQIPIVYRKYRPTNSRFSNENAYVDIKEPSDVLSEMEIEKIRRLARHMEIDYGEFDVLRDKDGRIYVVDANPTPIGPPNGLKESDRKRALSRLKTTFKALIERYSKA